MVLAAASAFGAVEGGDDLEDEGILPLEVGRELSSTNPTSKVPAQLRLARAVSGFSAPTS